MFHRKSFLVKIPDLYFVFHASILPQLCRTVFIVVFPTFFPISSDSASMAFQGQEVCRGSSGTARVSVGQQLCQTKRIWAGYGLDFPR